MNKMNQLLSLTLVVFAASCGDDGGTKTPDAAKPIDAKVFQDAVPFPAAPTLGTQIDRLGRPAINTALNHSFTETNKGPAKDAYNTLAPAMWGTATIPNELSKTFVAEFAQNLAIIDGLDTVCGNQGAYDDTKTDPTAYAPLAGVLIDDELYVDSSKSTCAYLALETEIVTGLPHSACGGRQPTDDIADISYSLLASGAAGFDTSFNPKVKDNASVHADVSNTVFPFFGTPHQ